MVLFGAQRHTGPNYGVFRKTLRINLSVEDESYSQMESGAAAILETPEEPLLMVRMEGAELSYSRNRGGT